MFDNSVSHSSTVNSPICLGVIDSSRNGSLITVRRGSPQIGEPSNVGSFLATVTLKKTPR